MDGEKWSDWKQIQIDPDDGADHVKNAETFSKLVYVGSAKYLQYRVKMKKVVNIIPRIKDIKVTFINSRDGQKVEQKKSFWELLFDWVDATVDKPPIVSRVEWGADDSLRFNPNGTEKWPHEYQPVTDLFVHHTDTELNDPDPPASAPFTIITR
jgi:hypothetical protein